MIGDESSGVLGFGCGVIRVFVAIATIPILGLGGLD